MGAHNSQAHHQVQRAPELPQNGAGPDSTSWSADNLPPPEFRSDSASTANRTMVSSNSWLYDQVQRAPELTPSDAGRDSTFLSVGAVDDLLPQFCSYWENNESRLMGVGNGQLLDQVKGAVRWTPTIACSDSAYYSGEPMDKPTGVDEIESGNPAGVGSNNGTQVSGDTVQVSTGLVAGAGTWAPDGAGGSAEPSSINPDDYDAEEPS